MQATDTLIKPYFDRLVFLCRLSVVLSGEQAKIYAPEQADDAPYQHAPVYGHDGKVKECDKRP